MLLNINYFTYNSLLTQIDFTKFIK